MKGDRRLIKPRAIQGEGQGTRRGDQRGPAMDQRGRTPLTGANQTLPSQPIVSGNL